MDSDLEHSGISIPLSLCPCTMTWQMLPSSSAAWRNGIASDYDSVIRRSQVRPLRWSLHFCLSPLSADSLTLLSVVSSDISNSHDVLTIDTNCSGCSVACTFRHVSVIFDFDILFYSYPAYKYGKSLIELCLKRTLQPLIAGTPKLRQQIPRGNEVIVIHEKTYLVS